VKNLKQLTYEKKKLETPFPLDPPPPQKKNSPQFAPSLCPKYKKKELPILSHKNTEFYFFLKVIFS
jgi:hypothetical protein